MDTVSAKGMAQPFKAADTGKIISGRGACDDKGPLASLFATLIGIKNKGYRRNFDITLVCTVDEENTMAGAARFAKGAQGKYEICLALEPSLLQPIAKHKGAYRCRIIPPPQAEAVAGGPPRNREELIKDILADLAAYKKATESLTDPQLGRADITLTEIKGDSSTGSVAEPHRILVDIRMLPSQSPAQIHGDISRLVGTRGKVVPLFAGLGIDSNPADPYIQKFQESLKRQGLPADLIALPCPSDCSQQRGQGPCLVWGPGNPDQAHRQEEYIELSQIKAACRVLTDFLTS
jgi:acetylornithine deacetylase/succinyl-diaminopimelate desuccinylase-like protein